MLLGKDSTVTRLIISDSHIKYAHVGVYSMLAHLRKHFWVLHYYSVVRKYLRGRTHCKRFNARAVKLTQSSYQEFKVEPPTVPFRFMYIDYMGFFYVNCDRAKVKVWLLCFTCMWSRAVNLKICRDLTVTCFLRAMQLHVFEHGISELIPSDLGSQITVCAEIIETYLNDNETKAYCDEHKIRVTKFDHYFKGCSKLGGLVESVVKLNKRLLFGAVRNLVLSFDDFEFLVCKTIHIANRRPVAMKEGLRSSEKNDEFNVITPENLFKGYDLTSFNIIPELESTDDVDFSANEPNQFLERNLSNLHKARKRLADLYHSEYLAKLVHQATDRPNKYVPVKHDLLEVGDVVLLKESYTKPSTFPMGIVKEVFRNLNNETTGALVFKSKTRKVVQRHA